MLKTLYKLKFKIINITPTLWGVVQTPEVSTNVTEDIKNGIVLSLRDDSEAFKATRSYGFSDPLEYCSKSWHARSNTVQVVESPSMPYTPILSQHIIPSTPILFFLKQVPNSRHSGTSRSEYYKDVARDILHSENSKQLIDWLYDIYGNDNRLYTQMAIYKYIMKNDGGGSVILDDITKLKIKLNDDGYLINDMYSLYILDMWAQVSPTMSRIYGVPFDPLAVIESSNDSVVLKMKSLNTSEFKTIMNYIDMDNLPYQTEYALNHHQYMSLLNIEHSDLEYRSSLAERQSTSSVVSCSNTCLYTLDAQNNYYRHCLRGKTVEQILTAFRRCGFKYSNQTRSKVVARTITTMYERILTDLELFKSKLVNYKLDGNKRFYALINVNNAAISNRNSKHIPFDDNLFSGFADFTDVLDVTELILLIVLYIHYDTRTGIIDFDKPVNTNPHNIDTNFCTKLRFLAKY